LKHCSHNTAHLYFSKFQAVIADLIRTGEIEPFKLKGIQAKNNHRQYLTTSELRKLMRTPCQSETVKNMALFSALTGLRYSDISTLTTGQIKRTEGGQSIEFIQQKTGGVEYLPISEQAATILENQIAENRAKKNSGQTKIFDFAYSSYLNRVLNNWLKAAGVQKKISFHCFRHSMAVMQLEAGTDIYTLSKLLGHTNVKTTEIYAKITDRKKIEAVNRVII